MAKLAEQVYPTNMTDAQWALIAPLLARSHGPGHPAVIDQRRVVNAILSLLRTGCQWRMLPTDYPNWNTVRYHFDDWKRSGAWERAQPPPCATRPARHRARPTPTAGIRDASPSRPAKPVANVATMGEKKVLGRKRHIVVDTLGHTADRDGDGGGCAGRGWGVNRGGARGHGGHADAGAPVRRWRIPGRLGDWAREEQGVTVDGGAAASGAARLRGPAPALGGRAHLRLAGAQSPAHTRCRIVRTHHRNAHLRGILSLAAQTTGSGPGITTQALTS